MSEESPSRLPSWVPTPARFSSLAWSISAALQAGGLPDLGLVFHGGLGDDLMATAVAREIQKRSPKRLWLFTNHKEIFEGNSDFTAVPYDHRLFRLCNLLRVKRIELDYPDPPPRHLIATLCASAGIAGEIDLRPYVYLTDAEKGAGKRVSRRQIAIQRSGLGARYPMTNKQWPVGRFQEVVDTLKLEFDFVQVGAPSDPVLHGCLDLRGKTTLRQTAAILAASTIFVGLVGGLMHLARAVECRSVIIYGGREHPSQSGYSANENIYWDGACSPCWLRNSCDFGRMCMEAISAGSVVEAVKRHSAIPSARLTIDKIVL